METAIKSRLNVIKGGGSKIVLRERYLFNKKNWVRTCLGFAPLPLDGEVQQSFDVAPKSKLEIVKSMGLIEIKRRERKSINDFWYFLFLAELSLADDSNPYFMDMLDEYARQIPNLYRGGITPKEAAKILVNYKYSDYPFPSGGRK